MKFVLGAEVLQVLVAGEDLVCALAGQDDLDVPGGELGEYVVGNGTTHQRRVEALDGTDNRGQNPERVLSRVNALVVLGIQILGDGTGCQEVGRILEAHGEGLEPPAALLYQRAAMAATRLESRPPERKTPTGTSPIICLLTVLMSRSRTWRRISCGMVAPGSAGPSKGSSSSLGGTGFPNSTRPPWGVQ